MKYITVNGIVLDKNKVPVRRNGKILKKKNTTTGGGEEPPPPDPGGGGSNLTGNVTVTVKFASTPSVASSAFTELKYDKASSLHIEYDDVPNLFMDFIAYVQGGVAPIDGVNYTAKIMTDGCGNNIPWTGSAGINVRSNFNNNILLGTSGKLTNADLRTCFQKDCLPSAHGYYHNQDQSYTTNGFTQAKNIGECRNYIYDQTGFNSRIFITPNNDAGYNDDAEAQGVMGNSSQNVTDGYPQSPTEADIFTIRVADTSEIDGNFRAYLRGFLDDWNNTTETNNLKARIDNLKNLSVGGTHKFCRIGTHGHNVSNWTNFKSFLDYVDTTSEDTIWVTTLQEFLEYFETKREIGKSEILSGDTLTITLNYNNLPPENLFRDISLKITSDAAISSITVTGAQGSSYNLSTKLINVFNRKHNFDRPWAESVTNSLVPLTLKNFYQDNNYLYRPSKLIDNVTTDQSEFTPENNANNLIYYPHDLVIDLRDYKATVRKVSIYSTFGDSFQTKVIVVREDTGAEVELGTYTGAGYNVWTDFNAISTTYKSSKVILRSTVGQNFGAEVRIYADYIPYTERVSTKPKKPIKNMIGFNAHNYNFIDNVNQNTPIITARYNALKQLKPTSIRFFDTAQGYQPVENQWAFNPVRQGWKEEDLAALIRQDMPECVIWTSFLGQYNWVKDLWNVPDLANYVDGTITEYTTMGTAYAVMKVNVSSTTGTGRFKKWHFRLNQAAPGGTTLTDFHAEASDPKTLPVTGIQTWNVGGNQPYQVGQVVRVYAGHASQFNYYPENNTNAGRADLQTWADILGVAAFVYATRKGTNPNAPDYTAYTLNGNIMKKGTGYADLFEGMNEPNGFWLGYDDFLRGAYLAPAWSVMYDGHKGQFPGCGVKQADPNFKMSISGLATIDTDLLREAYEWCRENRGLLPNGEVDLPFDYLQFHAYNYTGGLSQYAGGVNGGLPPELGNVLDGVDEFNWFSSKYADNREVWIGEWGIDVHPNSPMNAPAFGPYTAQQTRANWGIRTIVEFAAHGLDRAQWYRFALDNNNDENNPTQFYTMDMVRFNDDGTTTRRTIGDYFVQIQEFGDYIFDSRINNESPRVLKFVNGTKSIYIIWAVETPLNQAQWGTQKPQFSENVGTYNLALPTGTVVKLRRFVDGATVMSSVQSTVSNNIYQVPYSAKPVIVEVV
jgi:hypothetical protein